MCKNNKYSLLILLIFFSLYCSFIIGETWDERIRLTHGKVTLNYLFSLGGINQEILFREVYSTIYWSVQYLFTSIFPSEFKIQSVHLLNLIFSLSAIFGISKISRELFNKKVGEIVFLILFFYPAFFGHMGINNSDTIIAFSHTWITYLILRYLRKQNFKEKVNKYIILIALLTALATGIQLVFLGSLIPLILFIFLEVLIFKKVIRKNFDIKKFFFDLIKSFFIFYILLLLFWIDTHENIFILPFEILTNMLASDFWTGWPSNLINGEYFSSNEVPKSYLFISLIYKSPEYFLLAYLLFPFLMFRSNNFFKSNFKYFNYKILFIIFIILFSNLLLFIVPFPVYDGLRLFLWTIPYLCIIPGLLIYYLIKNFNLILSKISFSLLSFFIIYFLYNFLLLTPYQYTYLNLLNGQNTMKVKKFENDYWGTSLKELIKKTNFDENKIIKIATCGVNPDNIKNYFKLKGYKNIKYVSPKNAEFIIMTNRVTFKEGLITCFEKFKGIDVFKVERKGFLLSTVRKIEI